MKIYTKIELITELHKIRQMGWIQNTRPGNAGGVGNTLEDLLGIEENNLPLANAGEWELKAKRADSRSLITLCHQEPSPRAIRFVPAILLPKYGWRHAEAGQRYSVGEMSFRQTISAKGRSDRGFCIVIDRIERKILVSFDANAVNPRHEQWLRNVDLHAGLGELSPQPYWGFDDLRNKIGTKLLNCCFVKAERRKRGGIEEYCYSEIYLLSGFSIDNLINGLESGHIFIDFDARTGHNHGTKFRMNELFIPDLYTNVFKVE